MSLDDVLQDMAKDFLTNLLRQTLGKLYESWYQQKEIEYFIDQSSRRFLYYLIQSLPARSGSARFFLMSFQNELS